MTGDYSKRKNYNKVTTMDTSIIYHGKNKKSTFP